MIVQRGHPASAGPEQPPAAKSVGLTQATFAFVQAIDVHYGQRLWAKDAPEEGDTVAATQERLEMRISSDEKQLLEEAAERRGLTLTAFVLSNAHEAAVRTLETAHVIELTRDDQYRFVEMLLNPPAPSARLRAAAAEYREHTSRANRQNR